MAGVGTSMGGASVDISEEASSSAAPAIASSTRPLGLTFRLAQAAYTEVDASTLPSTDAGLQARVLAGVGLCETALVQVERQDIFSSNELAEDVNTVDLKYLLLPFYRAELMLRVCDQPKRLASLREALKSLRGFVGDQERLELLAPEAKGWQQMGAAASSDPATVRTQKIARLKASKAAKQRLELVRAKLAKRRGDGEGDGEEEEDGDDDLEREQQLLLLQSAVHTALDSIRAAEQEAEMLAQIEKLRREDGSLPAAPTLEEEDPRLGLQMLSLLPQGGAPGGVVRPGGVSAQATGPLGLVTVDPVRDPSSRLSYATAMQQIHTGEIPGLYTYTVEEGLRYEEAERAMAEAARMEQMAQRAEARGAAKVEREEGNDEEDEEERLKLIKQDEFREMNKRGSGNRKNRS